ncbi:MAG: NAD(P)-dependent oxidoreductase [Pseudonocardiaceae bacterium]|nr:NAD(P)-dependent oxidoreductase [Pseudonocardiaceae bacterium]
MTFSSNERRARSATVVGLGPMGAAIARAFIQAGVDTTVWNRTRSKADALAADGARVAADLGSAVGHADLVVTVLRDHQTTRRFLETVPADLRQGRTFVVLASSSPAEARQTQAWAEQNGLDLLQGAIMVPEPLIGTDNGLILYCGDEKLLDRWRPVLEIAAPRSPFLGLDPGLAALHDTAMVQVFFAAMTAFLHSSAMATAQGLTAKNFLPWAEEMLAILPATFEQLAHDVDGGAYSGAEDNLLMELSALEHIHTTSVETGVDPQLPALMRDLARRALDDGHGADSWSRIVEGLRSTV